MKHTPILLFAAAATMAGMSSLAEARPDASSMTCNQVRSYVKSKGAVVMNIGPRQFRRFVRDQTFCAVSEYPEAFFGRTRDKRQCLIGYVCSLNGSSFDN